MYNSLLVITVLFSLISLISFIIWIFLKIRNKHSIFSPFSITLYIYVVALFIAPIFFGKDEAWYALGISDASTMQYYLCLSLIVNHFGFIVFNLFMCISEFSKNKSGTDYIIKQSSLGLRKIVLDIMFIICILSWYVIVLLFNRGIPLLNGGRTFYLNSIISPVYLALNEIIRLLALFYGIRFLRKKKDLYFYLNV